MGVDVVLKRVEQPGTGPERRRLTQVDVFVDDADTFARLCEGSGLPMLGRVDPYGTLVLTSVEMEQFLAEVAATRNGATQPSRRTVLDEVGRLARICQGEACTELHLEGD